jgi:peroxiredoxin Q/BCP
MTDLELKEGMKAPDFTGQTLEGPVSLADYRGKTLVLYFYPKDDTPGCTTEACNFRDNFARLKAAGVEVLGVSKDSLAAHRKFQQKYELPFRLLSDTDLTVLQAYGAWKEKIFCGKCSLGIERSTFVIDGKGVVRRIWRKVKAAGHVDEILSFLETMK